MTFPRNSFINYRVIVRCTVDRFQIWAKVVCWWFSQQPGASGKLPAAQSKLPKNAHFFNFFSYKMVEREKTTKKNHLKMTNTVIFSSFKGKSHKISSGTPFL